MSMLLRREWANNRRRFCVVCVVVILAAVSLIVNLPAIGGGGEAISELEQLRGLHSEISRLEQEYMALSRPTAEVRAKRALFWSPARDGSPESVIRSEVENAAREAGLMLKSVGALQRSRPVAGVEVFELTVSGDGGYGEIAAFMAGLGNLRESYLWRSVTINPDNANNPSFLMFNGTVKVVSVDDPELSEWLWRRGDEAVL